MPAGSAANREELERLVAALERSGLAEGRAEIAALLAQSRALLGTPPPPRPHRRTRASARGKLRAVLLLLLDALAALGGIYGAAGLGFGTVTGLTGGLALGAALAWGLWRWGGLPALLAEGLFRLRYALRWALLWLAEPFHDRAYDALEALLDAREVMRGWQAHRRTLPTPHGLRQVEAWLASTYGPRIAARFTRLAQARHAGRRGRTPRGGRDPAQPLPEARMMRWSSLIQLFEAMSAGGALWEAEPDPPPPPREAPPPAPRPPPEPPERAQRRLDLRELLRKKRQDITTAYGWKLKTAGEIAQRDAYLHQLRAEIAALEQELAALGAPPPG